MNLEIIGVVEGAVLEIFLEVIGKVFDGAAIGVLAHLGEIVRVSG